MAKFAIALCILLVACGTQGAWTDDAMNQISSAVESFMEEVQSYRTSFEKRFNEAMSNAGNFAELVDSTMERAKDEWEAARKELSTLSEDPEVLSKCMNWSDNFGDMADEMQSTVSKCIAGGMSDVTNQYETTKAAIEDYTKYCADMMPRATECMSDFWTAFTCLSSLVMEVTDKGVKTWNELREKDQAFMHDLFTFEGTTSSCNFLTSLQKMVTEKQEVFANTERCITDANSARKSANVS